MNGEIAVTEKTEIMLLADLKREVMIGIEKHTARLALIKAANKLGVIKETQEYLLSNTIVDLEGCWEAHAKMGQVLERLILRGRPKKDIDSISLLQAHGLTAQDSQKAQAFHRAKKSGLLQEFINKMRESMEPPRYLAPAQEQLNQERKTRKAEEPERDGEDIGLEDDYSAEGVAEERIRRTLEIADAWDRTPQTAPATIEEMVQTLRG